MRKLPLILAIVSFTLALLVFSLADAPRSIYSGILFVVLGGVLPVGARQKGLGGSD